MAFVIQNNGTSNFSILGQTIVSGGGFYSVPNGSELLYAINPNLQFGINAKNIAIGDGVNFYANEAGIQYLFYVLQLQENSDENIATRVAQTWSLTTGTITGSGTSETPLLLLNNPNTSSQISALYRAYLSAPQNTTGLSTNYSYNIYNFYWNPTISANGTQLTISSNRQSINVTSSLLAYKTPTTSNNGTLFKSVVAIGSSEVLNWRNSLWVEPGYSMLITVTQAVTSTISGISLELIQH